MMSARTKISLVLPAAALLFSYSIFAFPAFLSYMRLQRRVQPGTDWVTVGELSFNKSAISRIVLSGTAIEVHGQVAAFNIPAVIFDALATAPFGSDGNPIRVRLGLHLWRIIAYPILALPAWWFVGRGMDGLGGNVRMTKLDLVLGLVLSIAAGILAIGLGFGLSDSERAGQDSLSWFIGGLGLWWLLFAIPAAAWGRAKAMNRRQGMANPPSAA
jgi:hypothetical protein